MKKIIPLFSFLLLLIFVQAQSGNSMMALIGKSDSSQAVTDFVQQYDLQMANNAHYVSTKGVELVFKNAQVFEIKLYHKSPVYGDFADALPHGLSFGMTSEAVKGLLGKPTLAYTSTGYCEYQKDDHVLSCWFVDGHLDQVVLSAKGSL